MCRLIFHSLIPLCLEAFLQLIGLVCDSGFKTGHYQIIIIPRWLLSLDIGFIYQVDDEHGATARDPCTLQLQLRTLTTRG